MLDKLTHKTALLAAIALLAILPHLEVFSAEFVWDDEVVAAYQVPHLKDWRSAVAPPVGLMEWSPNYFRPLVTASYILDNKLNGYFYGDPGLDPAKLLSKERAKIPHATSLLFHVVASVLTAALAGALFPGKGKEIAMLVAGAIFALHPAHGEVVNLVAGRSDSLSAIFGLSSLILLLSSHGWLGRIALSAICVFLALLCKESALFLLLVFPLAAWLFLDSGSAKKASLGSLAVAVLYFALRAWLTAGQSGELYHDGVVARLLSAIAFYLRKAIVPWPMLAFNPELPGAVETLLFVAVGFALFLFACKSFRRGQKLWLFLLVWFVLALAPVLYVSLIRASVTPVAERHLYLPSVAFALAGGAAAVGLCRHRQALYSALFLLLGAYAVTSWQYSKVWSTPLALWEHVAKSPASSGFALPWCNLGKAQMDKGDLAAAEESFKRALVVQTPPIADLTANAYFNLGVVYFKRGKQSFIGGDPARAYREFSTSRDYSLKAAGTGIANWLYFFNAALAQKQLYMISRATGNEDRSHLASALANLAQAQKLSPGNESVNRAADEIKRL